ncbi:MAG: hypothetical protein WA160_14940 [Pseudobdellovibrio sp.]
MKHILSTLILISTLPTLAFQGGVSGGGGNIISPVFPNSPVSAETAEHIVYGSHTILKKYINRKLLAYKNKQLSEKQYQIFLPIFNSSKNIETIINTVRVLVPDEHSCWDAQKNPVDGSTITNDPNSICISAYNIATKVDVSDIPAQASALMLHEYGELAGLNEVQAVQAQTEVLNELRGQ